MASQITQVVTLASALAHAAREGGVPDSFVVAMVRAALEGPAPRAKRKVGLQPGRVGKKRQRNHRGRRPRPSPAEAQKWRFWAAAVETAPCGPYASTRGCIGLRLNRQARRNRIEQQRGQVADIQGISAECDNDIWKTTVRKRCRREAQEIQIRPPCEGPEITVGIEGNGSPTEGFARWRRRGRWLDRERRRGRIVGSEAFKLLSTELDNLIRAPIWDQDVLGCRPKVSESVKGKVLGGGAGGLGARYLQVGCGPAACRQCGRRESNNRTVTDP